MAAQPATAPAPSPRPAGEAGHHLRLERLEYGKPCIRPDGPIEAGSEHGELGRSADFPPAVARWCDPSVLGVVSHSFESLPSECPHGTVLRPVVWQGRVLPVLGRVRSRPEDGEGGAGRSYTLARYLVSGGGELNPLVLFEGMEGAALRGLTRAEAERGVPPVHVAPSAAPPLEPTTRAFLRQAVVFALSGVPMAIVEPVEEARFFAWVAALWWLLPPPLRPLLSAGWGVGRSLSGTLAVSYATEPGDIVAAFSATDGTWTPPPRALLERGGHWETVPFQDRRLIPGRMYAFAAFDWLQGSPEVVSLSLPIEAANWGRGLPAFGLPELPEFRDPVTVRTFRWPGLKAVDSYRSEQLRQWLETAAAPEASAVEALATDFIYPESEIAALEGTVAALAQPERRARAELLLRRLSSRGLGAPARGWLLAANRSGAARARLIASGHGMPGLLVLDCLREATASGEAEELADELAAKIRQALDDGLPSLDATSTEQHAQLLLAGPASPVYLDWARRNPFSLLFALARWQPPAGLRAFAALEVLDRSGGLHSLVRWATGEAPAEGDVAAVATLPPKHRQTLGGYLSEDWERPGPDLLLRRERVLEWARVQAPEPATEPLLRFALGADDLGAGDVQQVAEAVESGVAPASLAPRLATLALREWGALGGRMRQRAASWAPAVAHWPWEVSRLLLDHAGEATNPRDPATAQLARDLRLTAEEVQVLIDRWLPRLPAGDPSTRAMAEYLWHWAVHSRPGPPTGTVGVCRELEQGRLPQNARVSDDDVATVIRLATESGAAARLFDRAAELWNGATAFWSVRLVLEMFPDADLVPSAQQLELLVRQRAWIAQHLGSPRLHQQRAERFRVAMLRFHQAAYPGDAGAQWRDDFSATILWAVFRGVPLAQQGSLAAALAVYAAGAEERARHCLAYLEATAADVREEAVLRVLNEEVVPSLRGRRLSDAQIRELFERLGEQDRPQPRSRRERISRALSRWLERLRRPMRIEVTPASAPSGFALHGRRLVMARWFFDFLRTLVQCRAALLLPRALAGRFGGTEI